MKKPLFHSKRLLYVLVSLYFTFSACRQTWHLSHMQPQRYPIEENTSADSAILAIIAPYKAQLTAAMNVAIGQVDTALYKQRPEGTLNNFVADLLYDRSMAYYPDSLDFAMANYGGLRLPSIPKGPITIGKVYELMPFDNQIVILEMDGKLLQRFLDHVASLGGWPVSSQLRFSINDNKAVNVTIHGKPIEANQTYTLAIPDYIANGGDRCDFLKNVKRKDTGVLIRDAIIEYIRLQTEQGKSLSATLDERVKSVQ